MIMIGPIASFGFLTIYLPPSEPNSAYTTHPKAGVRYSASSIICVRSGMTARHSTMTPMMSIVTSELVATAMVATISSSSVPRFVPAISCALTTHGILRLERLPVRKERYMPFTPTMGE